MSLRHGLPTLLALAFSTTACAGPVIDEANEHAACVLASEPNETFMVDPEGGPTVQFVADAPLWVGVDHGCRPCGDNLEMGCTVEVEGDEVIVESTFNYEESRRPCDTACGFISSKCQTSEAVPAGSYTIRYGDRTAMLEVPSSSEVPCFPRL